MLDASKESFSDILLCPWPASSLCSVQIRSTSEAVLCLTKLQLLLLVLGELLVYFREISQLLCPASSLWCPTWHSQWSPMGKSRWFILALYSDSSGHPSSVQFSSVTQSCLILCDPMNRSMPGLPVYHQPPEFTQTHVHRVGDAIQPSHPLSSPSPPVPNPSQHQGFFQSVNSAHEVAKILEFQFQHQSFQWTPRTDLL